MDAKVLDSSAIKDAFIFVNEQKVYYKQFDGSNPSSTNMKADLKLKPGVNFITMVARKDENYDQHETIAIFSESGDPFKKKEAAQN